MRSGFLLLFTSKSLVLLGTLKALNIHLLDNKDLLARDCLTRSSLPFQFITKCVEIISLKWITC